MLAALRFETAPPPLAIAVAGQDLASCSTTWTALPDLGETTLSAADSLRELDYMHARYRSPLTSRFLSTDPVGGSPGSPQGWNRYAYTRGNPLRFTDPTGQYEEDVHSDLTTVLAEAAGFSPDQAAAIGGADQGTDEDPATEPFASVGARINFHFTTEARRAEMWGAFEASGEPKALGQFLHAEQDSYSHAGFGPRAGHASAGHAPDKTYNDPAKAYRMAQSTYRSLVRGAARMGVSTSARTPWSKVSASVNKFNRAKTEAEKARIIAKLREDVGGPK